MKALGRLKESKSYGRSKIETPGRAHLATLAYVLGSHSANKKKAAAALETYITVKEDLQSNLESHFKDFEAGDISVGQLRYRVKAELADAYQEALDLGMKSSAWLGGVETEDQAWLKTFRRDEWKYLNNFIDDVEAQDFTGQLEDRIGAYVNTVDAAFWTGRVEGMPAPTIIHWRLGDAEHCFPAGTLIDSPNGEIPIEQIQIGDYVETLDGPRRVTRTYRSLHYGPLRAVSAGGKTVYPTPKHPFMSNVGWVAAGKLTSDNLVLLKHGSNVFWSDVAFPDTDDRIATFPEIGIPGAIPSTLRKLSLCQWVKSWMPVPILAVCFDDNRINQYINHEFAFDLSRRNIINSQVIQYRSQFQFQLARMFLGISPAGDHSDTLENFGMSGLPSSYFGNYRRAAHWIVGQHESLSGRINQALRSFFVESYAELISATSYGLHWLAQALSDFGRTQNWIMFPQKIEFANAPNRAAIFANRSPIDDIIANRAALLADSPDFSNALLGVGRVAALYATKLLSPTLHWAKALFTSLHRHINLHSQVTTVYNLEVEGNHHYIANGFVAHNCDDCLVLNANSPYTQEDLPTTPAAGDTQCLSHCKCYLEFDVEGGLQESEQPGRVAKNPILEALVLEAMFYGEAAEIDSTPESRQARDEAARRLIDYLKKNKLYSERWAMDRGVYLKPLGKKLRNEIAKKSISVGLLKFLSETKPDEFAEIMRNL